MHRYCDGNGVDECERTCSHAADDRCEMAGKKDGLGAVEMEEAGAAVRGALLP